MTQTVTSFDIEQYLTHLQEEEKSPATIEKYRRDLYAFSHFLQTREKLDRPALLAYKKYLMTRYKVSSTNSMLAATSSFLQYLGRDDLRIRGLKQQRQIFCSSEKELTRDEYIRLLKAASARNRRLYLIMQTICSTGIRISELPFITKESLVCGQAQVSCKSKIRIVLIPKKLCRLLQKYTDDIGITSGSIFVTRSGRALNRSYIWAEMKKLCGSAGVAHNKVYPHNLRHLFARSYYQREKDIVRLADILGHSSIETTRIYTVSSGKEHAAGMDRLGLVLII